MRRLALPAIWLCCLNLPIEAATRSLKIELPNGSAPDEAEVFAIPMGGTTGDVGTGNLTASEFQAAAAKGMVIRGKVDSRSKTSLDASLAGAESFRIVIFDKANTKSIYTGTWPVAEGVIKAQRLEPSQAADLRKFLESPFGSRGANDAATTTEKGASPGSQNVLRGGGLDPIAENRRGKDEIQQAPLSTTPKPISVNDPAREQPSASISDSEPFSTGSGFLRRAGNFVGSMIENLFFFLCWIVVVFSSPVMFYLAWRFQNEVRKQTELLRMQIEDAHQEIRALRSSVVGEGDGGASVKGARRSSITSAPTTVAGASPATTNRQELKSAIQAPLPGSFEPDHVVPGPMFAQPTSAGLAEAFVEWCTLDHNSSIHDLSSFGSFLETRFGAVELGSVYRDRNAGQENLRFTSEASNAQDPTEFWTVHSLDQVILLPRPGFSDFSELQPAYETARMVLPQNLRSIVPAVLFSAEDGSFRLRSKGQIS